MNQPDLRLARVVLPVKRITWKTFLESCAAKKYDPLKVLTTCIEEFNKANHPKNSPKTRPSTIKMAKS